tara:strand:+ start:6598 stop:8460 length:1863 start_codon:yes stop_codon:yes gene_type:complete
MCGISLIVNKNDEPVNLNELSQMNRKVLHRGPDDDGIHVEKNLGFGFQRLSIIDLSNAGHQPMSYSDGNVIIFNGEIFNYVELKKELNKLGVSFRSKTDTEVILAAYNRWGEQSIKRFNGMWGFVLYDRQKEKIIISRDRFGIKPVYFWFDAKTFAVASEIKQFYALRKFKAELEPEMAFRFLYKNQLNVSEKTFFKNVYELRPGNNIIYDLRRNEYSISKYYDPKAIKIDSNITYDDAIIEFARLFNDSVKIRLRSDVDVGACLSGGLDSTSIISIGKDQKNNEIKSTISSCFSNKKYDEQEYIDMAIDYYKIDPIKIFPDINDLVEKSIMDKIIYHQDQPIKSTSHFSEFSVFESARKNNLTVMLDGQGADEFLGGYLPFQFYNYSLLRKYKIPSLLNNLYHQKKNHFTLKTLFRNNISHFVKKYKFITSNYEKKSRYWLSNKFRDYDLSSKYDSDFFDSYRNLSLNQIMYTSLPYQLHSEDRNSMLHSIESRLPFLDFDLANFMLSLPDSMKLENGTTKRILRNAFKDKLPSKIVNRHQKMGFMAPEEELLKKHPNAFRSKLKETVDTLAEIVSPKIISELDHFIDGKVPYDKKFFRLFSFQSWSDIFLKNGFKNYE